MHTLSTKELRGNMPLVRSELKKGTSFLLIHQSQPIAQIHPVKGTKIKPDELDREFEAAALADINDDEDFLTQKEIKYYLSLK